MVRPSKPKLTIKTVPGLFGPKKASLRLNQKASRITCQGGHQIPKGWYVKLLYGEGDMYYDMDYCLHCSILHGWVNQ